MGGIELSDEREEPMTFRRALRQPDFWLLLVAAVAATAGLSAWIVMPMTVAGLSISSLPKYVALWPRAAKAGAARAWWTTVLLSMLNNLGAAAGVVLVGALSRWLWL
jgi:hypothetical protein